MDSSKLIVRIVIGVAVVAVGLLIFYPRAKERLAPRLVGAHVAVLPEGSTQAVVGPVAVPSGRPFSLHAVLEAEDRDGGAVYYTEAPGLVVAGEPVPAEAVRPWDRAAEPRVFWFTVEGQAPFVPLRGGLEQLERLRFTEFFRPAWPATWSVPGVIAPGRDESLTGEEGLEGLPFGTQRYQVRIEFERGEGSALEREEYRSVGADELPGAVETFPGAIVSLPGPVGVASSLFGLTQIGASDEADRAVPERIAQLTEARLAFSRASALREVLEAAGTSFSDLAWIEVEPGTGVPWADGEGGVAAGDLLRAGSRAVVLYEDRGELGVLDRGDAAFDFERGAAVRPLGEIFVGEAGEGLLELARLPR